MAAGLKSDNVDFTINATGTGTDVVFQHNGIEISKASQMIGVGQTWIDETSNRALGTTYTNTTGKPIFIIIYCATGATQTYYINGIKVGDVADSGGGEHTVSFVIPDGDTYMISGGALTSLFELK